MAIIGQDNLRRFVLQERDVPGGANIGLIDLTVRYALDHGFHVVLEGILTACRYGEILTKLAAGHPGPVHALYLDVPFAETLVRHATKPQAAEYGEQEMHSWYTPNDLIEGLGEHIIGADSSLDDTADLILTKAGLRPAEH
ncbi:MULTISPECIES: kinase [unclassified Streptomyces]|uniref:kinase n=1 Tax=unclassified Streptomyces TaxID=2593676 RepID=UPI002E282529|nr:kinase [Streptomyces sp. NBC_00190]